jgi:hypothetical protein
MLEFFPEFISNSSLLKISENYLKEERKKNLNLTHLTQTHLFQPASSLSSHLDPSLFSPPAQLTISQK